MGAIVTVVISGIVYALRVEPYHVGITRLEIPVRNLPPMFDGMTLVQISDLHFGTWMTADRLAAIVCRINDLQADCIVITGDFVSRINQQLAHELTISLKALEASYGIYGVFGNHDHWSNAKAVWDAVTAAGVRLLINENITIERDGRTLHIAGVDDIWENEHDLDAALDGVPSDSCVILLAHEPDFVDQVAPDGRIALQLSGHTHGGQVRLPLIGAPILPVLGTKHDVGLYTVDGMNLYVNRGIGMMSPYVRFRCPPEITHITLRVT